MRSIEEYTYRGGDAERQASIRNAPTWDQSAMQIALVLQKGGSPKTIDTCLRELARMAYLADKATELLKDDAIAALEDEVAA